jgi:hypothetical protein
MRRAVSPTPDLTHRLSDEAARFAGLGAVFGFVGSSLAYFRRPLSKEVAADITLWSAYAGGLGGALGVGLALVGVG